MVRRRPLEKIREIFSPLRLPLELTVKTKECGMSNAWYQRPTITICYEYLRDLDQTAPKETSPEGITPAVAVVGQCLYTASHEMGHAVFDLLDVPLFGRPEDDADQFAAYVLIRIGKNDARQLIEGAAYLYKDYAKNPTVTVPVTAFADVHGAPMRRLYNLLCLAYGANSDQFSDVVDNGYLPKSRVPACKMESTAVRAVAWPRGRATQAARARHALPIREADMAAALPNVGSTLDSVPKLCFVWRRGWCASACPFFR
jgi:hypothetical protein